MHVRGSSVSVCWTAGIASRAAACAPHPTCCSLSPQQRLLVCACRRAHHDPSALPVLLLASAPPSKPTSPTSAPAGIAAVMEAVATAATAAHVATGEAHVGPLPSFSPSALPSAAAPYHCRLLASTASHTPSPPSSEPMEPPPSSARSSAPPAPTRPPDTPDPRALRPTKSAIPAHAQTALEHAPVPPAAAGAPTPSVAAASAPRVTPPNEGTNASWATFSATQVRYGQVCALAAPGHASVYWVSCAGGHPLETLLIWLG